MEFSYRLPADVFGGPAECAAEQGLFLAVRRERDLWKWIGVKR